MEILYIGDVSAVFIRGICVFIKDKIASLFVNIDCFFEDGIVLKIKHELLLLLIGNGQSKCC